MKMSFPRKAMTWGLSALMAVSTLNVSSLSVLAEDSSSEETTVRVTEGITVEKIEDDSVKGLEPSRITEEELEEAGMVKDGNVRVSIIVDGDSTIDAGYSVQGIGTSTDAKSYRASLKANQDALAAKISKEALGGAELDVVWNLTLAANMISANVPYAKIDIIKKVAGVKDVIIETQYEAPVAETSDDPNMAVATDMTGTTLVLSDYTGAGQKVAIIDTGLDTDHRSFDSAAYDYAIENLEKDVDVMSQRDVAAVFDELNASQRLSSARAADVYLTSKVPYAFNYIDSDLDVTHDNDKQGEHGSHVSGIAAANRYVEKDGEYVNALDEVYTQGQAPDAQILVMKVFGKGGGAYDSDYFAAIEDAIILGADSCNLSLGSSAAGFTTNSVYGAIMDSLAENDTVVTISAGNNYDWSWYNLGALYSDDVNYATGGSPGSYTNSFTVASIDNDGFTGTPLKVNGNNIFYDDGSNAYNEPMTSIAGEYNYIAITSVGTDEEMAALADVLDGKIAVVSRGSTSFFQKANAAVANGAVATIIYNNQSGTISMNLTGYLYTAPAVSITLADGYLLLSQGEQKTTEDGAVYYEGTLTVTDQVEVADYDADYLTMSNFSSWGPTGDLNLKPEITAPGGNIYSVNGAVAGGQAYEVMSGTSMAAPQVAGLTALMHQYIEENDLVARTGKSERQLTQSLLMSTAKPVIDEYTDYYYSVLKQGSGLADVSAATSAKSFIEVRGTTTGNEAVEKAAYTESYADGKVKAMFGEDADRTGLYTVTFDVTNFSDEDTAYDFNADIFTQDISEYYGMELLWEETLALPAVVTFTVDGEAVSAAGEEFEGYDFNDDGVINAYDAVAILDYVVGTRSEIANEEYADIDEDGDVDTYDAYLALDQLKEVTVEAAAGQTLTVTATIDLNGSLDEIGNEDRNGAYVEGYVFVKETTTEEGVEGVEHSIPVLGYFGSWSEPSMTDKGSYLEYLYEEEDRAPYMYYAGLGNNALSIESFGIKYAKYKGTYYFGGNPQIEDETYHPERNAINSKDTLASVSYSQIRNAGAGVFYVTDDEGNMLDAAVYGSSYAAYYYANGGAWYNTSTNQSIGYKASDVEEGTQLTFNYVLVPEYYLEGGRIDLASLEDGAYVTISAVVDNTAPELVGDEPVALIYDEDTDTCTGIEITAVDNQYISAVALFDYEDNYIDAYGGLEDAEAGEENVYAFEIDEETPAYLYVALYDYAMNETIYKINLNADEEFTDPEITITLSDEELSLLVNSSYQLKATVLPWGYNDEVVWTSDDETIAAVDEEGIVTGISEGETTIRVASAEDPDATAECIVTVKTFDIPLNGIVWDENGEVWFSEFNTNSLPNYEKLHDSSMRLALASATYDENGTLYAASFDSDEWVSTLYTIDEETYEATAVGDECSIGFMDICKAPSLGDNMLLGVYGTYVVLVNKTTGDYEGAFNLSSYTSGNYLVGIAYEEQYNHSTYGLTDWVFLVDEEGNLYETGFLPYNGSYSRFGVSEIGEAYSGVDIPYFQSLYFDGTNLFWSRFNYSDNKVNLVMVEDIYNSGNVWNIGSFDDSVWPVGGLYEDGVYDTGIPSEDDAEKAAAVIEANAESNVVKITPTKTVAKGSLNIAAEEEIVGEDDEIINLKKQASETEALTVKEATLEVSLDAKATNALYRITYDPELLELTSAQGTVKYSAVNDAEAGEVVVGFISENALAQGTVIAELTFTKLDPNAAAEVAITTEEFNDEHPGTVKYFEFTENGITDVLPENILEGTQVVRITGDDWGAGIDKSIIHLSEAIDPESVAKDDFKVTQAVNGGEASERTVLTAYTSDEFGNEVDEASEYVTVDLRISPAEGSPIIWSMQTWTNSWADPYELNVSLVRGQSLTTADGETVTGLALNTELNVKDIDSEDTYIPQLEGYEYSTFEASDGLVIPYGLYTPAEDDKKNALIIWNHGVGERGTDPRIALLGNEVTALNGEEFQALFEGAYVLVPQTPANTSGYDIVDGKIELIEQLLADNPDIDADRVIVGGCSMGGGQTMNMVYRRADLFAAAYPICPASYSASVTDEQIENIANLPIWFTHCTNDNTVNYEGTTAALIERIKEAGNENVHLSAFEDVHDTTGRFDDLNDGETYQYATHWSWVYFDNNECYCDECGLNEWEWLAQQNRQSSIEIDPESAEIVVGETFPMEVTYQGGAEAEEIVWTSSDESVATVDAEGNVFGVKVGYATITAETGGMRATCEIRVLFTDVPAEGEYYSDPVYWAVEKGITNGFTDEDGLARRFGPADNCTRAQMVTFLWRLAGKPEPASSTCAFSDVDAGQYYYKAVLWAAEEGITKGYADGTFRPDDTCLREHAVTFLWRAMGKPAPTSTSNQFTDVKTSDYYYNAVLWAAENNITKGYADDNYKTFRPKKDCLREHIVTFMYRAAN